MSRINTNVNALIAQRIVNQNNQSLNKSLERLSTGLRINRGGDDPAGLIASENLRAQKASINAAISNAERADQVINIAEGGLTEINSLLLEVQDLVGRSANDAGMSTDEKEANQLQIDSILQTIDRIAESTSFQGTKLLNGSFDFTTNGQDAAVQDFNVNAAKLNAGDTRDLQVLVTTSAQHAGLYLSTNGALDMGDDPDARFVFEVAGAKGAREFSFASGTAVADIVATVNSFTDVTGVSAAAISSGTADGVMLKSTEYGDDNFVSVQVSDDGSGGLVGSGVYGLNATNENALGALAAAYSVTGVTKDSGQDLGAVINGITAATIGTTARISSEFLDVEVDLADTGGAGANAQTLGTVGGAGAAALTITGGGAKFNLGPNVDISNQVSIGIANVASRKLGSVANGFLDSLAAGKANNVVTGDLTSAQKVVNDAISTISSMRGRLGAFQKNTVGATIRSLGIAMENTAAAESAIRDTDFAAETANLTRNQILVQAASTSLAIAKNQPQNVLALLG